jgi:hypothetical protein
MKKESDTEPGDDEKPIQMNALVAEFNAVRAEILFRATSQGTLMQINITAAGAIASFALAGSGNLRMLIIISILSPLLGMLWIDHHNSIAKLGGYIKERIKADYERVAPFTYPDYKDYMDASPSTRTDIISFSAAVLVTFGFLPLSAGLYVSYQEGWASMVPTIFALILQLLFVLQFARAFWGLSFGRRETAEPNSNTKPQ